MQSIWDFFCKVCSTFITHYLNIYVHIYTYIYIQLAEFYQEAK